MKAAATCSKQSGGSYNITITPEANSSDASRQLAVQRLAAHDSDYSLLNMDTIWTAEFAAAGWLKPITGADRTTALQGRAPDRRPVSRVPGDAVRGAAEHQRAAALVPQGPRQDARRRRGRRSSPTRKKLPASDGLIEEQGAAVRGLHRVVQQRPGLCRRRGRQRPGQAGARQARGGGGVDHQGRRDVGPRRSLAVDRSGGPGTPRVRGRQGRVHAQLAVRLRRRPDRRGDQLGDQARVREHGLGPVPVGLSGRARASRRSAAPTSASRRTPSIRSRRSRPRCA